MTNSSSPAPAAPLPGREAWTLAAGVTYLYWFVPGLALQFAMISMGSALRGTGIVTPTIVVQVLTVVLNAILAPVLISGWLTGMPLGIAYAMWGGLGIVLTALISVFYLKQSLDLAALAGIALIVAGVIVMNTLSNTVSH